MYEDKNTQPRPTPLSFVQGSSVMVVSVMCGVNVSILPLLLTAEIPSGRLTLIQLGHAATAELLSAAVMTALAGALFEAERLKLLASLSVLAAILANLITMFARGNEIVIARLLSGAGNGVLVWMFIGMMIRSSAPARQTGIYSAIMSGLSFLLAIFSSQYLLPRLGAKGGFGALIALDTLMLIPALLVPTRYAELPKMESASRLPSLPGLGALISAGAYVGGVISFWVYAVPLAAELGQTKSITGYAISITIIFQIVGGALAAIPSRRFGYASVMCFGTGVAAICLVLLGCNWGVPVFFLASALFGIIWITPTSFHVMLVLAADPTRRSAMFVGTAHMLGVAVGPLLASLSVSSHDVRGALTVSAALFSLSLILLLAIQGWLSTRLSPTN